MMFRMTLVTVSASVAFVLDELRSRGSEKTRATYARHGLAPERTYGVSVADLKLIAKSIRGQQELAYDLYDSGILEAMYLAGIIADGAKMSEARLQAWAEGADGLSIISDYTVPWVTVEHPMASKLAMKWISSKKEFLASSGWATYSGLAMTKADADLDLKEISKLLDVVVESVHQAQNRERAAMNSFLIVVGSYVTPLMDQAKVAARQVGNVSVDVGDTACKIPVASESIAKVEKAGKAGKKRKTIRC
jgi:3-methyladenine DNA glycosylase AlkD